MHSIGSSRQDVYDVAILGSGFAGSMLGAILARQGASVMLLDSKSHPKFAIGESTIPNMLVTLRTMALRYDVPELMTVSTFTGCQKAVSANHGQKIHFGFLNHQEGQPQDPRQLTMFNFPKMLLHPAAHMMRQDVDAYLYNVAIKYGCATRTNFHAEDVDFDGSGVTITSATGDHFRARYVVDASGYRSPLAEKFQLREDPPRYKHHSRAIWNHFLGVPKTDDVFRRTKEDSPPVRWYDGTVHHLFDKGWFWVIGFDNHESSRNPLCSVGLTLDPRAYPKRPGVTAEEDFWEHANRFPDIARQFEGMKPVREWVSTDRLQYSSTQTVGDRWALLAHAAAFIDPLFSRGLHNTCEAVNVLAWRILRAVDDDDFSAERFEGVNHRQQSLFDGNDKLVAAAYQSFSNHALWSAVFRIWAWGSNAGTFRALEASRLWRKTGDLGHLLELEECKNPGLHWSDHEGYGDLFNLMVEQCDAYAQGRVTGQQAADTLYSALEESPFVPRHWGWTEPNLRFINPTPKRLAKTMYWAATKAQPDVRRIMLGFLRESTREMVRGRRVL
uniref:FADH2-dependent halogenase n=1 Tax=Streptomyces sp. CNQ-418 TaxID=467194 RepID=J7H197_9ACTN|nr:FADH2-dependent halogenase [Streptomyces sp. CNQ-418]